ncbi:hypothetical protein R82526_04160 [Ralstonia mannitolilytica]|uniref:DUF5343 domain-containing protein n=1 Tax=Ralstonia mannitolilytica TaxID=105219 RepID=UPI000A636C12|nr:DUF5343 domain-containing protein [Ralstonia mannitolilytica]CAJ0694467.1 hypothetical protein R82526_04160 [Ralstonia mannitolilytica]CAJ0891915.1 hypothetical protein R76727_04307 [Ralstonia mannitolilytica]
MPANLPYVATPGSIKTALERIRSAATPERVTKDFVTTVLQIKGGTGGNIPPFLKRIGFVGSDGTPTDLYRRFRNPATGGTAVADAIKLGYKDLLQANEYFYRLSDKDLLALIVQVTGVEPDNRAAALTLSAIKILKSFADFDAGVTTTEIKEPPPVHTPVPTSINLPAHPSGNGQVGLNLSYTINLNLPATADQAVFNAIFRSLKEHLLSGND